jgi:4-hydroxy-tetrahydrodipicolinate synthase
MLYALFDRGGNLDRRAMRVQIEACVNSGAHGVAVLGLATEVAKLSSQERHQLAEWVAEDLNGRLPLAMTVFGNSVTEQVSFARHAASLGAQWVILQPPRVPGAGDKELLPFFADVMSRLQVRVAVQNAPEYIGIGLTHDGILRLAQSQPNFTVLKGEGPVLQIRTLIEQLQGRLAVFNGRAGLELPDNLRAGCAGVIPGVDMMDRQARIFEFMHASQEDAAEALYREILPAIVFVMQSVEHLVCYGKRLAAARLGLDAVYDRHPALGPTAFGLECVRRYAKALGPLTL